MSAQPALRDAGMRVALGAPPLNPLKDQWQRAEKKARRYVEHAVGTKLGAVMDLVAA